MGLHEREEWVLTFLRNLISRGGVGDPDRQFLINALRRIEAAFDAYSTGKTALADYLESGRNTFSPDFRALRHFEETAQRGYEAARLIGSMTGQEKLFKSGDETFADRLNKLQNASKHADERIANGKLPENGTVPVWLTNDGIECVDASLSYEELAEFLREMARLAELILASHRGPWSTS